MGLSTAVTAIVARRIGEKIRRRRSDAAVQAIAIAVLLSLPFSLAGIFYAQELLALMGADEWVSSTVIATPSGCWAATW